MDKQNTQPKLRFPEFTNEWEMKKMGDLFLNRRQKGNENLPIFSVTQNRGLIRRDSLDRKMQNDAKPEDNLYVESNDLAYNMMRMWQGAIGIANQTCMVSPAYIVLKPKENVSSEFFLQSFQKNRSLYLFTSYSYGLTSDRLRLYFKDFSDIKFHIPCYSEQQKISNFLNTIDDKLTQLKNKKVLLEQYMKGVTQKIFTQQLRFKNEDGEFYEEWEKKKLGDCCKTSKSGGTPISTKRKYYDGDIPFLSIGDMTKQGKYLQYTTNHISYLGLKDSASWIVPANSIIYSMYASVGFVAINKIPMSTSQAVLNLILNDDIDLEFMYYTLVDFQKNISKFINTGTQGNLNAESVNKFTINLPCIAEQKKIANFLSVIDDKINHCGAQIEKMEGWKKGLLQQMFV